MRALSLAFWFSLALGLVLIGVALVTQNNESVSIRLFTWESPLYPRWLMMVLSFLGGVIVATLYFIFEIISLEAKNIRLRRNLSQIERVLKKNQETDSSNNSSSEGAQPNEGPKFDLDKM